MAWSVILLALPELACSLSSLTWSDYQERARRVGPQKPMRLRVPWQIRAHRAELYGERVDIKSLGMLRLALRDPHPSVRTAAAQALGRRRRADALPMLRISGRDPVPAVRRATQISLASHGDAAAMGRLIAGLGRWSPAERERSVSVLGTNVPHQARLWRHKLLLQLVSLLGQAEAACVRDAELALSKMGITALPAMVHWLNASSHRARPRPLLAMQRIVRRLGGPGRERLLAYFDERDSRPTRAEAAGRLLAATGPEAIRALIRRLDWRHSLSPQVALLARKTLLRAGAAAVPPLAELLSHQDPRWRKRARTLLSKIRSPQSTANLLRRIEREPNVKLRRAYVTAMIGLKHPRALPVMRQALRLDVPQVTPIKVASYDAYRRAIAALAPSADQLRQALDAPLPQVRLVAAQVAGDLRIRSALPKLTPLLKDEHGTVARAAARALGHIGDPLAVPHLLEANRSKNLDLRAAVLSAMGRLGARQALQPLIKAAMGSRPALRVPAIIALGRLGYRPAVNILAASGATRWPALRQALRWSMKTLRRRAKGAAAPTLCRQLAGRLRRCGHNVVGVQELARARRCAQWSVAGQTRCSQTRSCQSLQKCLTRLEVPAQRVEVLWWDLSKGRKRQSVTFRQWQREGPTQRWHASGQLAEWGHYVGGKRHRLWRRYWSSGRKRSTEGYFHGRRDGPLQRWQKNGHLVEQGRYQRGVRHGPWRRWHPSGQLRDVVIYYQGAPTGSHVSRHANGRVALKGRYQEGERQGPWSAMHPNGRPHWRVRYELGQRVGDFRAWHPNGQQAIRGLFQRGRKKGYWRHWDSRGRLRRLCFWRLGKLKPRCHQPD